MNYSNTYIDAYVLAVPTENKEAYLDKAKKMAPLFKEHGAIKVTECWGDDVPQGEVTSFPLAVKCKKDETVAFGFIVWESKEKRDVGMQAAMEDKRLEGEEINKLFDGKRMIFGGFDRVIDTDE